MIFILLLLSATGTFAQSQYYVESTISNPAPYVGQQTIYRFRIYTLVDLGTETYTVPPDFEGLWRTDFGEVQQFAETVNGQFYSVAEVQTALFPNYAGNITIGPEEFVIPATVFRDEERLQTQPINLTVLPLPDGAPPEFSGAVGKFNMSASIDRTSLTQGEPLKLSLTVSGTGNVEQLPAPELPIPDEWGVYTNPTTYRSRVENGLLVGEKTFEWLITPSQPGQQTLPQINLWYFDPDPSVMAYRAVSTSSVNLDILPGTAAAAAPTQSVNTVDSASLLPPKPIPTSLQVDATQTNPGFFFWLLVMIPPVAAVGAWVWARQRQIEQRNQARRQASEALQKARGTLQAAAKAQPDTVYRSITQTIYTYFGDKLQRQPSGLNQADLRTAMEAHLVPAQIMDVLVMCLEWADSGRYAPAGAADTQTLIERTNKALTAVDNAWK
jgi:hypothetical protein